MKEPIPTHCTQCNASVVTESPVDFAPPPWILTWYGQISPHVRHNAFCSRRCLLEYVDEIVGVAARQKTQGRSESDGRRPGLLEALQPLD